MRRGLYLSVDVAEQCCLRRCPGGESGCGPVDQLGLEGRPQVLGEGIVEAVADASGGRGDAGVEEALGAPDPGVLAALVGIKPNSYLG